MNVLRLYVLSFVLVLTGCSMQSRQHSFGDTPAERVATLTNLLSKRIAVPGPMLDAECIEEQQGDGRLGPSDYRFFARIVVEEADFAAWKAAAGKPITNWDYLEPQSPLPWWPSKTEADSLEMFSPKPMFGRANGWVGFDADGQTIYVLTFTL